MLCLISMIHSVMLHLFFQCRCLFIRRKKRKEWIVYGCHLCTFFLSSSPHRLSFTSVVFDFSTSPNDIAPVSPIILPVVMKRNEKSELLMKVICVSFFLLSSPLRLSFMSVVFEFNDSINDTAPISKILFTVDV